MSVVLFVGGTNATVHQPADDGGSGVSGNSPAGGYPKLAGCDVLVVDDEAMIASVIKEMLSELGCGAVWIAGTNDEALSILAHHRPHLALLDVNLGHDTGFRLAQKLADDAIPFLFATGYGRFGLSEPWASRPVIQKPFRLDTLAAALAALR